MAHKVFSGENPLAVEIAEFIQEYLRNSNILLTIAHQSIEQLDEQLRQTLLSLGTYLFGRPATKPEARILADALFQKNPYMVKYYREKWEWEDHHNWVRFGNGYYRETRKQWVLRDWEPTASVTLEEQQELFSQRLTRLGLMQFMCRPATSEGEVSSEVFPVTIADVDRDAVTGEYQYPDQLQISEIRSLLAPQSGMPVESVFKEQEHQLRDVAQHSRPPARQASQRKASEMRPVVTPQAQPVPDQAPPDHPPKRQHQTRRRIA